PTQPLMPYILSRLPFGQVGQVLLSCQLLACLSPPAGRAGGRQELLKLNCNTVYCNSQNSCQFRIRGIFDSREP
ncbi:MAG: hypothetical protein V3U16_03560, partial [Candidatus Neomarinimicrobiota bacterium]